jgi:small subunit ribosomal protein S11
VTPASLGVKGIEGAEKAGETVGGELLKQNCLEVVVTLKGIGAGKLAALKGLKKSGVKILSLQDVTAIPFNGCRPPKKRRI